MKRNFGVPNVTTREPVGGNQIRGPHYSANTRADNVIQLSDRLPPLAVRLNSGQLPSAPFFITADAPLPRGKFTQAMFDILTALVWLPLGLFLASASIVIFCAPFFALGWLIFFN